MTHSTMSLTEGQIPPQKYTNVHSTIEGLTRVRATIHGQIAVHRDIYYHHIWVVTHARTGYAISAYTIEHVAHNFARRINTLYDLDALTLALEGGAPKDEYLAIGQEIKKIAQHVTFTDVTLVKPPQRKFTAVQS